MASSDDEILDTIINKTGASPRRSYMDSNRYVVAIVYDGCDLTLIAPEIGRLAHLERLILSSNHLRHLPPDIGQLTSLRVLHLNSNNLDNLPAVICSLGKLAVLDLSGNQLNGLPAEVGSLAAIESLDLGLNHLTSLPAELGMLRNMRSLYLAFNNLKDLPKEIGSLRRLQRLDLRHNQLTCLPTEIAELTNLKSLKLDGNPDLTVPPPEVVKQGTKAILEYLRHLKVEGTGRQYRAKLVIVGEGDTGKTCVLRRLQGKGFIEGEETTYGIDIDTLDLPHPSESNVTMRLATWDFGGQHVYHATHQLFLTKRSLYLLCWNARKDPDQCKLDYWLRTIGSLAPDAPVLLVATHTDERAPDIDYPMYAESYRQLIGSCGVSNMSGDGIDALKMVICNAAARLPQMGEAWPKNHVAARQEIVELAKQRHHICRDEFVQICGRHRITGDAVNHFASTLHDLGHILYFHHDTGLDDIVILQPEWITKAISKVLTDEVTRDQQKGVLDHKELARIWSEYDRSLHPAFMRLMEKFDLSYRLADQDASVVAQLLPYESPAYEWPDVQNLSSAERELAMDFELNFVPAGIMTWFIVRTHRFSVNQHWRNGVYLEHDGHRARARFVTGQPVFRLEVRGPVSAYFFGLLKDSVDRILERFPGLEVKRNIPCICHEIAKVTEHCIWQFSFRNLVERQEKGLDTAECQVSFSPVPISRLLYGIHPSTNDAILHQLQKLDHIGNQLDQLVNLNTRNFLRQWNLELAKLEADCPSLLTISPMDRGVLNKSTVFTKTYDVQLWCQMPGHVHPIVDGSYELQTPEKWLATLGPWLRGLVKTLKYAVTASAPRIAEPVLLAALQRSESALDRMKEVAELLPMKPERLQETGAVYQQAAYDILTRKPQPALGTDPLEIYELLDHLDPEHKWGGLRNTISPEGDILWLCPEHYKIFDPGLPTLEDLQGRKKK